MHVKYGAWKMFKFLKEFMHFLRRITKTKNSTPHYMLYAELGRHPIDITIKSRMIGFWNRIVTGKK